jgi:hypothetical protein
MQTCSQSQTCNPLDSTTQSHYSPPLFICARFLLSILMGAALLCLSPSLYLVFGISAVIFYFFPPAIFIFLPAFSSAVKMP